MPTLGAPALDAIGSISVRGLTHTKDKTPIPSDFPAFELIGGYSNGRVYVGNLRRTVLTFELFLSVRW
jgi:hypothetical protein